MEDLSTAILQLLAVILLVGANGFFVAAEFSLVSVRRTRIAELVASGNASAEAVQKAISNPDRVIAATQLGITLASLGLGWIGEPALSHWLYPVVRLFPGDIQSEVSHSIAAGISFAIITFLHVVVGELAPKSIALQDPERTSLMVARPTLWVEWIFKPVILVLNGTGNALLKLVGVKPASGHELVHSVNELKMLVTASAESGVVEEDESEMLHAIFDFGQLLVRQVMIPRTEIVAVDADMLLDDVTRLVTENSYTKLPVYEDDLDQILGILHIKDLLRMITQEGEQHGTARALVRETLYVPETLSVNQLLHQFRDNRQHIAIVMDEYGGTAGLVTLEDILEEIVGEVRDPFEDETEEIQTMEDGTILVNGLMLIEDVNHHLGLNLIDPHYDTIAGYMMGKLGRIPKTGDVIEAGGVRITVDVMDGMRVERLQLTRMTDQA
jgi:CBS domain containing-hemolysin-like protein